MLKLPEHHLLLYRFYLSLSSLTLCHIIIFNYMAKSGRLTLVQSVLCAMPIHAMMALALPMKTIAAMNKICRGFLWCRRAEANGGNCAVAWDMVCSPKWAGGLGLPNLLWMNGAMQAHWPWLQITDETRPWSEFRIPVAEEARLLCQAAMRSTA